AGAGRLPRASARSRRAAGERPTPRAWEPEGSPQRADAAENPMDTDHPGHASLSAGAPRSGADRRVHVSTVLRPVQGRHVQIEVPLGPAVARGRVPGRQAGDREGRVGGDPRPGAAAALQRRPSLRRPPRFARLRRRGPSQPGRAAVEGAGPRRAHRGVDPDTIRRREGEAGGALMPQRRGGRGRRREARAARPERNLSEWAPKTKLGRLVLAGELTTLGDAIRTGLPIREPEIVDILLPETEDEVLDVNMVQRMTDSGRRVNFVITCIVGNKDGFA